MTLSSILCHSPIPLPVSGHRFQSNTTKRTGYIRLRAKKSNSPTGETAGSQSDNVVLRAAWYGSELLGIAASYLRPNPSTSAEVVNPVEDGLSGPVAGRVQVVEAIKQDFHGLISLQRILVGNLTLSAYEEDCEFADPAGSFRGLSRFKRNCSNFGSLLLKSNMKLTKWEDILRIKESDIGGLAALCRSLGGLFFQLLATPSITLITSREKFAGMSRIGMFPKWHYLSKYSGRLAGFGAKNDVLYCKYI